jgi:hypothetical protein
LNENDALSLYSERLNKIKISINLIKSLIDNTQSYSVLLLLNSIIDHIDGIIDNSNKFFAQITNIYEILKTQKKKIEVLQESIDEIYNDSLTEKLIGFEYEMKRNKSYLWNKNFLSDNLKQSDEYDKLWGGAKGYYNPFAQSIIPDQKVEKMKQYLDNLYTRLQPQFNDLLRKLKEKRDLAKQTQELNNYISELLKINGDD